ncbi:MAG: LapA family protein [Pseudomonadota bacterium]
MLRSIKYLFLGLLGAVLIVMALANRNAVTLRLLPEELASFVAFDTEVTLPLFLVMLASVVTGLLIGFVWEWLREGKHRGEASRNRRAVGKLERQVKALRTGADDGDDVLSLLEDNTAAR